MTFQKFTGREYLKIDIASNFGLEKSSWDDRLTWFDQNEPVLHELLPQAEEPALYFAGVKAWEETKAGRPTGYMISLDATSSGLQLLAALTGDRSASELCNVVDVGVRQDAYTAIYGDMLQAIGDTSKITREQTKEAIMTSLYGSTAVPKRVFGEGALLDIFYHTMHEVAPAVWELNEAMLALWNPDAYSHDWVLPDNFHVHIKVMNQVKETVHFLNQPFEVYYQVNEPHSEGRSLGANTIHSIDGMIVREMSRRCDYDPKQVSRILDLIEFAPSEGYDVDQDSPEYDMAWTLWSHYLRTNYISARILDYVTENTIGIMDTPVLLDLLGSLPAKPFKVISIHDCFRCHPNYGNDLRQQYNLQLTMIARSNLLGNLISQLVGKPVSIGKLDKDLHLEIMETNYALS